MKVKSLILFGLLTLSSVNAYAQPACYTIDCSRPEWLTLPGGFIRGDADNNGEVDVADVMFLINYVFLGTSAPSCLDAGDATDNGVIDSGDIVKLLGYVFLGESPPPPPSGPFPEGCGPDPTEDEFGCECHRCFGCSTFGAVFEEPRGENKVIVGKAKLFGARTAIPVYVTVAQPISAFSYDLSYDPEAVMDIALDNAGLISADFGFSGGSANQEEGVIKVGNVVSLTGSETLSPGEYQVTTVYLTPRKGKDAALTLTDEIFVGEQGLKIEPKSDIKPKPQKKPSRRVKLETLFAPSSQDTIIDHGDTGISDAHESFMHRGDYPYQEDPKKCPCLDCPIHVNLVYGNIKHLVEGLSATSALGFPLEIVLAYNSGSFFNGRYGYGWQLNYNVRYVTNNVSDNVIVVREDDRTDIFVRKSNGSFKPTYGVRDSLAEYEPDKYVLVTKRGTKYWFESPDHHYVTRLQDPNHNELIFAYNGDKQLTSVTDSCGRQLLFEYQDNKLTGVTGPGAREVSFGYDEYGDLRWISNPLGDTTKYEYYTDSTECHDLKSIINAKGDTSTITYNSDFQVETITACCGTETFSYDSLNRRTTQTDKNGHSTIYTYDSFGKGRMIQTEDALGGITKSVWDDSYNKIKEIDANDDTTHWTYDSKGNVLTEVNALGHTTWYTWDPVFNKMTSEINANYDTTTWEYDSFGNLVLEINPLGDSTTYTYDSRGLVLTTTNARGYTTSFEHNDSGDRIRTIDAKFCTTSYFPDSVGNDTLVIDANHNPTRYAYDNLDRLIRTIDALDCTTGYFYDAVGNKILEINPNGDSTRYEYDGLNRLVKTIDALGGETEYAYDPVGNRISGTNCKGDSTRYEYDEVNRLVRTIDALDCTTRHVHDPVGNTIAETDGNGHTTTYEYDELNRLVKTKDAVGCSTIYRYDPVGNGITGIDGNGKFTYYKYDPLDRVTKIIQKVSDTLDVIDPDDGVTEYEYDEVGNRTAVVDPNGNRTKYEYNQRDELSIEINPEAEPTLYEYDCVGNRIEETRPNGNVITYDYDEKNQLVNISDLIGQVVSYTYDCIGNRLMEIDANNDTATYQYDALSRLVSMTDPLGQTTNYSYDCVGNLDTLIDRESNPTIYTYDTVNRLISSTYALGNAITYEYDCVGNQIRITDANGNATTYEYDGVNRLIREIYADSTTRELSRDCVGYILTRIDQNDDTTHFQYNDLYYLTKRDYPDANDDEFIYDKGGRLLIGENAHSFVTFEYDSADRVVETTQGLYILSYSYDIPNNKLTITYPGGKVITETRDRRDRLVDVMDTIPVDTIAHYNYDFADRLLSKGCSNGTAANYHYNTNDWMDSLTHTKGATLIAGFAYDFDKEGNRKYAENLLPFNPSKEHTHSQKYDYDAIYRLRNFKTGQLVGGDIPSPIKTRSWTLDPVGNWNQFTIDGTPYQNSPNQMNEYDDPSTTTCQPPAPGDDDGLPDDFMDRNSAHDCNGNLLDDDINTYEYDYENRLIRVIRKADGDTLDQYRYDALSRRIEKETAGVTIVYLYDGQRAIEERIGGSIEAEYVYGDWIDEVLTMDRNGQTYYYHTNSLGSIIAITDSLGNAVERYAYDAYGEVSIMDSVGTPVPNSAVGNPYLFTGRRLDEESGLYYCRARYYSVERGRFLQRDPLWYVDGMNLYEYVISNPIIYRDPFGMKVTVIEKDDDKIGGYEYEQYVGNYASIGGNFGVTKYQIICSCTCICNHKTETWHWKCKEFWLSLRILVREKGWEGYATDYKKWKREWTWEDLDDADWGTYEGTIVHERVHGDAKLKVWKGWDKAKMKKQLKDIAKIANKNNQCDKAHPKYINFYNSVISAHNNAPGGSEKDAYTAEQEYYKKQNPEQNDDDEDTE